jgi:hypothetical protein
MKKELEQITEEISRTLKETKSEIEKISETLSTHKPESPAAGAPGFAENTTQCAYACPSCLRSCCLTQGHYSSHQCSEGHAWI